MSILEEAVSFRTSSAYQTEHAGWIFSQTALLPSASTSINIALLGLHQSGKTTFALGAASHFLPGAPLTPERWGLWQQNEDVLIRIADHGKPEANTRCFSSYLAAIEHDWEDYDAKDYGRALKWMCGFGNLEDETSSPHLRKIDFHEHPSLGWIHKADYLVFIGSSRRDSPAYFSDFASLLTRCVKLSGTAEDLTFAEKCTRSIDHIRSFSVRLRSAAEGGGLSADENMLTAVCLNPDMRPQFANFVHAAAATSQFSSFVP